MKSFWFMIAAIAFLLITDVIAFKAGVSGTQLGLMLLVGLSIGMGRFLRDVRIEVKRTKK